MPDTAMSVHVLRDTTEGAASQVEQKSDWHWLGSGLHGYLAQGFVDGLLIAQRVRNSKAAAMRLNANSPIPCTRPQTLADQRLLGRAVHVAYDEY